MVVNDFLVNYFPGIIDFSFTARIEKEFDDISQGKIEWDKMIDRFYRDFHPQVETTEQVSRSEARNVREVGTDPESGKKVYAKLGKIRTDRSDWRRAVKMKNPNLPAC
jgi:DNA topoisomerase I